LPSAPEQHKRLTVGKAHQITAPHRPRERRGSARERGYTTEWDKFSKAFLYRNPLCEYCMAKGTTKAARVTDHDIPHEGDPELFWNNTFTACCVSCHNGTKASLEARYSGDDLLERVAKAKGVIWKS